MKDEERQNCETPVRHLRVGTVILVLTSLSLLSSCTYVVPAYFFNNSGEALYLRYSMSDKRTDLPCNRWSEKLAVGTLRYRIGTDKEEWEYGFEQAKHPSGSDHLYRS